ncbi:MAG: hypothetical protein KGD67_09460, partial [Candidatus Lokiarchaeota archaeon]|nr:hypothetical protein [Candidatus Lokiarchaeota archaeon]
EKTEFTGKNASLQKLLKKLKVKNQKAIIDSLENIESRHSIGFNKNVEKLFEIPVGEVFEKIKDFKETQYLIIDGILSQRLFSVIRSMKIKFIACKNKEQELRVPDQVVVYFF